MKKRVVAGSVVLMLVVLALIYWGVQRTERFAQMQKSAPAVSAADTDDAHLVQHGIDERLLQQEERKEQNTTQPREIEKAPATFGFMKSGDLIHLAGVFSLHDKQGKLVQYIDQLCREKRCRQDMNYQKDISDAVWQDDIVALLQLINTEDVQNATLLIDASSVKLEGKFQTGKKRLDEIIADLQKDGLSVANRVEISEPEAKADTNDTKAELSVTSAKVHKEEKTEVVDLHRPMFKVTKKSRVIKHVSYKHPKEKRPPVHKTVKKESAKVKRRVRKTRKPVKDIVAPSYMETFPELERKIKSNAKNHEVKEIILDNDVAEPKFEILRH